jgi:hypothetical protein
MNLSKTAGLPREIHRCANTLALALSPYDPHWREGSIGLGETYPNYESGSFAESRCDQYSRHYPIALPTDVKLDERRLSPEIERRQGR